MHGGGFAAMEGVLDGRLLLAGLPAGGLWRQGWRVKDVRLGRDHKRTPPRHGRGGGCRSQSRDGATEDGGPGGWVVWTDVLEGEVSSKGQGSRARARGGRGRDEEMKRAVHMYV